MQVVVCNIISLVLQAPLYTLMLVLYARYDIDDPRLEGDAEHGTAGPVPCGCASVLGVPMITPPSLDCDFALVLQGRCTPSACRNAKYTS